MRKLNKKGKKIKEEVKAGEEMKRPVLPQHAQTKMASGKNQKCQT